MVVLVQYINSSEMLMRDVGGYSFLVHKKCIRLILRIICGTFNLS